MVGAGDRDVGGRSGTSSARGQDVDAKAVFFPTRAARPSGVSFGLESLKADSRKA